MKKAWTATIVLLLAMVLISGCTVSRVEKKIEAESREHEKMLEGFEHFKGDQEKIELTDADGNILASTTDQAVMDRFSDTIAESADSDEWQITAMPEDDVNYVYRLYSKEYVEENRSKDLYLKLVTYKNEKDKIAMGIGGLGIGMRVPQVLADYLNGPVELK